MKKVIKLTEKDINKMVEKTLNEQNFDEFEGHLPTDDPGYIKLLEYLQPLVDQELIHRDIRDDILDLALSYADEAWREAYYHKR